MLPTTLCIPRLTASRFSAHGCVAFYLAPAYPLLQLLFRTFRKLTTLRDFPLTLSVQFSLMRVYGGLRGALHRYPATEPKSPRWPQTLPKKIRHYFCSHHTCDLIYILLASVQAPTTFARECLHIFFCIVIIPERHDHQHCMLMAPLKKENIIIFIINKF